MQNAPGQNNDLLLQLEDLGALTDQNNESTGLINIRPFRDWISSSWSKKIFTFRLCNVGELLDINNELDKLPVYTRDFASKIEFILRSIYKIDEKILVPEEEVAKYNEQNKTNLNRVGYLRTWINNIEPLVLNRLYSIYEALESKQVRLLTNNVMCEITGKICLKENLPKGSVFVQNCIGEVISKEGLDSDIYNKSIYEIDIIESNVIVSDNKEDR